MLNEKLAEQIFNAVSEAAAHERRWCDLTEAQRKRTKDRIAVRVIDLYAEIAPPPLPEGPGKPPVGP